MNNIHLKLAAALAIYSWSPSASAASYSALEDFSAVANPNGVWTFGRSNLANGGIFTAFDDYTVTGAYDIWRDNEHLSADTPSVWRRSDLNTLNFHPGPGGALDEFTLIRFTAPVAGDYNYSAEFAALSSGSTSLFVFHNAALLDSGTLGSSWSDSGLVSLASGDRLDVVIGNNGGYENDSTQVSFVVQSVPEPVSGVFVGLGAIALLGRRSRRLLA